MPSDLDTRVRIRVVEVLQRFGSTPLSVRAIAVVLGWGGDREELEVVSPAILRACYRLADQQRVATRMMPGWGPMFQWTLKTDQQEREDAEADLLPEEEVRGQRPILERNVLEVLRSDPTSMFAAEEIARRLGYGDDPVALKAATFRCRRTCKRLVAHGQVAAWVPDPQQHYQWLSDTTTDDERTET